MVFCIVFGVLVLFLYECVECGVVDVEICFFGDFESEIDWEVVGVV